MSGEQTARGPGRPVVPETEKRKHRKICVADRTWERWRAAAKRDGVSISQWIENQLERKR